MVKKRFRKKKKIINDNNDKMTIESIEKIQRLAADIAKQAMKVGARIFPEDEFLLYLMSEKALTPKSAIPVPEGHEARMYTLWSEDYIGHIGDNVYLTKKGLYVVELLKMKLRGDPEWKKYT
jgi:hypothetical protein